MMAWGSIHFHLWANYSFKLWNILFSLKYSKCVMFFSGTQIRIMDCLVKRVTTSTHTWTISCRTALRRKNKWTCWCIMKTKVPFTLTQTLLMTDALHASLYFRTCWWEQTLRLEPMTFTCKILYSFLICEICISCCFSYQIAVIVTLQMWPDMNVVYVWHVF